MRKVILIAVLCTLATLQMHAQSELVFKQKIYNKEENIYIVMNLYDKNVYVKDQEFMREMEGYLGDYQDFRKWFILDAEIVNDTTANISITNDEGSEDLTATISYSSVDQTYTLKQIDGSPLRTARNKKWHKLPKTIIYTQN